MRLPTQQNPCVPTIISKLPNYCLQAIMMIERNQCTKIFTQIELGWRMC
ncbi:hypothetical protein CAJAP_04244 [Camponotus japonicus]